TSKPPYVELVSGPVSADILSALNLGWSDEGGEEFRTIEEHLPEIRFGPANQFRLDPLNSRRILETTAAGDREFLLPQSTYDQFVKARPAKSADSYPPESVTVEENIGPSQVVGSRLWFGKNFYDGEGDVGVGGIGYF